LVTQVPPHEDESRCDPFGRSKGRRADALKDNNDLVMQLAAKHGLEKAQRDVDALIQGRQI
jgi:hypothetical protein